MIVPPLCYGRTSLKLKCSVAPVNALMRDILPSWWHLMRQYRLERGPTLELVAVNKLFKILPLVALFQGAARAWHVRKRCLRLFAL